MIAQATSRLIVPFTLGVQPVERLFLVDLIDHPTVLTVEVQQLRAENGASGLRVLLMNHDTTVEVMTEQAVADVALGAPVGRGYGAVGVGRFVESTMVVGHTGELDLLVDFVAADGVQWHLEVEAEAPPVGRGPFLAPVGSGVQRPDRFFAVQMHDFAMLDAARSHIRVSTDGRVWPVARLPRALTVRPTLLARWSPRVVVAELQAGALPTVGLVQDPTEGRILTTAGHVEVDAAGRLTAVVTGSGEASATLRLDRGLVPLDRLGEGRTLRCPWSLEVSGAPVASGSLLGVRVRDEVRLTMQVERGWSPVRQGAMLRALTLARADFRHWPTSYRWDGVLVLGETPWLRTSRWSRVRPG